MKLRADTIFASFVVALFSSLITSLAVLLVRAMASSIFREHEIANLVINVLILFFFAGFVFFKGSALAVWLLYRHGVPWGYKVEYRKVFPIFLLSFVMSAVVFLAIQFYITQELTPLFIYLEKVRAFVPFGR